MFLNFNYKHNSGYKCVQDLKVYTILIQVVEILIAHYG